MPIIPEQEALRMVSGLSTMSEEERAKVKPLLLEYRTHHDKEGLDPFPSVTRKKREDKERFYSIVENPKLLAEENGLFADDPRNPAAIDELRATEVNNQFLANRYGKPIDEIRRNSEHYAGDYAAQQWNEGVPLDPLRFYARVKDEVGKEKQQGIFQNELMEAAFSASMLGDKKGWSQWIESARSNPAYKPEHEGRYFEAWNTVKDKVEEDLGDNAWAIRSSVLKMREDKGLEGDLNQAQAAWQHPERQLVDLLTNNPAGYQKVKMLMQKMAMLGTPEEKAGVMGWAQKFGESLQRGAADTVDGILDGTMSVAAPTIANAIGREDIARRTAAEGRVMNDLKDIANGIVDPVSRNNWFDRMAFGLADSAPAMLLGQGRGARMQTGRQVLALGYAGEAKRNFEDNGWTGAGSAAAASFVGVASAAVESISEGFKLPKAWRMTTQSMVKNYGAELAFRAGSEITEELIQDNMAAVTQTITSAIGLTPERDKGLLDEIKEWGENSLLDVALVSLPLAALGAKTGASDRISRAKTAEMTADKVELARLLGADAAETISAIQDPDERIRAAQETYREQNAADRLRHLTLMHEINKYQERYEQTMADTATSAISMTLNRDGWQVTQRNGETITVDSAEAARRVREELRQVQTVEEAAGLISAMDSWVRKGSETKPRSATLSGELVQSDGTAIIHSRDGKVTKTISDGKALTELREEAELIAGKNGNEDVFVLVNGSNSVFVDKVGGIVKGVVKRLDLNQSGVPQVMTFLHESLESSFNEGLLTGTLSPDMVTRAAKALFPVMDPAKAKDEDEKRLIESLERVAAGSASETEMRETMIELAVRDVLERDVKGRRTGYKAGTFAKALDAAMMTATSKEELTAFGKIAEFFRAISTMLKGVFGTVQALNEAKENGTLAEGNDFETFVDQMLGLDEQIGFDEELVQAVEGLAPDKSSIETYSIKVQTIAANKLADAAGVPSTLDKFYVGKKFIPMEADKTAAGGFFGETARIPAQGGPAFPLMPEYRRKKVVWASSSPGYWRGKLSQARAGGIVYKGKDGKEKFLVAPYAMKDDSHTSNATIIAAKFSELERYVSEGRLTAKQETAIAEMLDAAATKAKGKAEVKRDAERAILEEEGALDLIKSLEIDANQEMEEEEEVEEKPKQKKKKKGEDESQDRIAKALKEYKKHATVITQLDGILKFPKVFTASQLNAFRNQLNFPQRKWIADKLSSAAAEKLGVPPMDQVRRATLDPSTPGVSEMSIFSLLEIDVERLEAGLKDGTLKGSDFKVPEHGSYDTFAPGDVVAHFRTPVPYSLAMPTLKAELESQDRTNHPYYLKGRMPKGLEREQRISPDMLKQWNEAQIDVMPNQAKAIIAALNDKWIEINRAGQAGIADFVRAIRNNDAAITLSKYTEQEISALLKKGDMKIFRLPIREVKKERTTKEGKEKYLAPEGEIWFALKRPDGKNDPGDPKKDWTIVSVMNNEGGANGIMPLLLEKAVKSGGNHLDCFAVKSEKFPNGLLPTLYSRAGFKTFQDAPFAPEYYQGPGEMGELQKVWESQGWTGQERPGMVWMKHDGITSNANSDSVATGKLLAADANGRGMERGSSESAGTEAEGSAAPVGDSGQGAVRGGLPDGASAGGDAGNDGGILPRGDGGSARSVVAKVIEELRVANDSQLAALGISREEVNSAIEQYDNSTRDGITSYSVSKASAMDAEHLAAVKAGDMETAQRMVDEAASGNKINGDYIGEDYEFIARSLLKHGNVTVYGGPRIVVKSKNLEATIDIEGDVLIVDEIEAREGTGSRMLTDMFAAAKESGVENVKLTASKSLGGWFWANRGFDPETLPTKEIKRRIDLLSMPKEIKDKALDLLREGNLTDLSRLSEEISSSDYAPLETNDEIMSVLGGKSSPLGKVLLVGTRWDAIKGIDGAIDAFPNGKIKSADPVTYDEQGNPVPLSQRFNAEDNRISHSVSSGSRLEQVQAELDRRLSTDPARRRLLAQEALMKLENLRERWETERWTAKGDLIRPITEKRTAANLDREGAMRQAMAVQRILTGMGIDPGYATLSKDAKDYEAWQRYQESKAILIEGGMTEAEAERLAAASASTWRSKAVSTVRTAITQAKAEVAAWREEQDAMQKKDWSPKASLLRDLRTLDAMLSVLPPEVRVKVGGFIKLASYSTETARLEELNRRVAMIETELEKHLQKEIRGEIKEMFDKAAPKMEAGEKPKGAMTAESHRLAFLALAASKVPAVEVNGERQKLDDLLLEVDADVLGIAERMQILEMFGGMDEMNAASLDAALGWLTEVVGNGRSLWRAKEELRLLEQKMKAEEARMATGREGSIDRLQQNLRDEKTLKQESSGWGYELVSFEQVMGMLFDPNASVVKGIVEGIRRATYQRTDAIRQKRAEWQNAMSAIFAGKKWMDIQADLWDYAQTDSKSAMTVSWMKDRREKKIDVPLDIATRVVADPANAKALGFSDIEVLTIQRMLDENNALPAKNQKSTFEISRVFPGTPTGVPLSQNQAMNLTMLARQKDYQKALEYHGWTEDVIKEIESKLTREAKEMRAFLAEEYRAGYYSLNSVFQSMFGAPLPQILNYSPGTWEGMTADSTVSATGSDAGTGGLSASMFKTRRKHKAAPRLADAMVEYWKHVGNSEHFKAFAAPVRELKGVLLNPQLRASIEERGGKAGIAAITDWIKVFENDGVKRSVALGKLQEFQSRLQNAIATGVLAWNLGTLAKQSLASLGAAYEMPASEYLLRFSRAMRGKLNIGEIFKSEMIRRRVEQGASPELRQVMQGMMGQHPGSNWVTQNGRKFAAAGMDLLGSTDGYFTSVSAAIYYDWQLDQAKKAGMNDADAAAAAMTATEGMVDRTAQPVETMQKSLFEAKAASNPQSRWVFMFASEARQKATIYGLALNRALKGKSTRQDKQVLFISHVVAPMILQTISSMVSDWRDDDDKELLDAEHWSPALYLRSMMLGPMMGLPLLSGPLNSIISSLTGTTKFNTDATNPIGSAFSGFMSGVTKLNSDRKQKDDPIEIGVNMTKNALNIVSMVSQLSPIGAGNAWMGTAGAAVDQAFDYFSNATGVDK